MACLPPLEIAVPLVTPPPQELQAYVKSEIVRWAEVVRQAGAAASE